jgi:hypothetical protein
MSEAGTETVSPFVRTFLAKQQSTRTCPIHHQSTVVPANSSSIMVLEEALIRDEPNAYGDGAQDQDQDHDQNQNQTPARYHIKLDQLPRPVGFFLFPVSDAAFAKAVLQSCSDAQSVIKRPLRQDEFDAISYHSAKSLRTVSMGPAAGFAAGSLAAYRTIKTFGFPGYTPKPEAEGGGFNPDRLGPIRGQMARNGWHLLRFQAYGAMGALIGTLIFSSYATSVNAVATFKDPRMQDYVKALQERAKTHSGQLQPQGQRNPISSQEGRMDQQAQRASQKLGMEDAWKRQDVQRKVADYDDMSPTGGAWADDYKQEGQDTGLLTDDQLKVRERTNKSNSQRDEAERAANYAQSRLDRARQRPHNHETLQSLPQSAQQQQQKQSSGTSWERIRAESAAAAAASKASPSSSINKSRISREQQDGSTLGDSFAFSDSDQERQLAKSEAQKEFDARVEQERQGGDFAESGKGAWTR